MWFQSDSTLGSISRLASSLWTSSVIPFYLSLLNETSEGKPSSEYWINDYSLSSLWEGSFKLSCEILSLSIFNGVCSAKCTLISTGIYIGLKSTLIPECFSCLAICEDLWFNKVICLRNSRSTLFLWLISWVKYVLSEFNIIFLKNNVNFSTYFS